MFFIKRAKEERTWPPFDGKFTMWVLFVLGIVLTIPTYDGQQDFVRIIYGVINTLGLTLIGSVLFNFIISKSSFKKDCMDAAASVLRDKDLSRFSSIEIAEFYKSSITHYLFRERSFHSRQEAFLRDIDSLENSLVQSFVALHQKSIYMSKSEYNITITLEDDGAKVSATRHEIYCMPRGTEYRYVREISALKTVSAETYSIKSIQYNGKYLDKEKIVSQYEGVSSRLYTGYERPYSISWKFDKKKTQHDVKIVTEYMVPCADVFVSYRLKHYCKDTGYEVTLVDRRTIKNEKFRIATDVFSPAIAISQFPDKDFAERFYNMFTTSVDHVKFHTLGNMWLEPGSGYAITIDLCEKTQ